MKVIDVSKYNGVIQWGKVNADGVIIRVGYRGYAKGTLAKDAKFKANIDGAIASKLKVGVYFVTQALNESEAKAEAMFTLEQIKGYRVDLPIFIDSEDGNGGAGRADHKKLTIAKRTSVLRAFCEVIEQAGYKAGVYASEYWLKNYADGLKLKDFYLWVAKYSSKEPTIPYDAWQYSDKGTIPGISGRVDLSYFKTVSNVSKTNEEVAKEVIDGKWGTGKERASALEAAGYNYRTIQGIVNNLLKKPKEVYYTVKKGDSLYKIAKEHDTTVEELVKLNKITLPDKIQVGQKLRLK